MNDIDKMKPAQILNRFFEDFEIGECDQIEIQKIRAGLGELDDGKYAPKYNRLIKEWYSSLEKGIPNYSVYDNEAYFFDLIVCFLEYSRNYIRTITNPKSFDGKTSLLSYFGNLDVVVDLGCGMGYTTAFLKQIFGDAKVFGTNIKQSPQYDFAQSLGQKTGFSVIENVSCINTSADLIFASEYFEHFERPMEHLEWVIEHSKPKYLFIANSFNTRAIGHFEEYKHGDEIIPQNKVSRRFNKHLKGLGYVQIKTKIFNGKPTLWQRID